MYFYNSSLSIILFSSYHNYELKKVIATRFLKNDKFC